MGKRRYNRDSRDFFSDVDEEDLYDPRWSTPHDSYYKYSSCEGYSSGSYIQLGESRKPRRVPPRTVDAASSAQDADGESEPACSQAAAAAEAPPMSCAAAPQPQGPSRKERKRMAARERAMRMGTLADVVVEEGRVIDESEYVADTGVAFPIAGLPLDIVRDVLLFYIDVPTIVNAMAASHGFRAMMADDLLWRDVFRMHSLEQLDRKLWKRIRNRTKTWSQKSMLMARVATPSPQEQKARLLKEKHRQEMQLTKESAELRRMLKQRTDDWDEIEEQFYVHCTTGEIAVKQPMRRRKYWSTVISTPDYNYFKQYVRKSEALPMQYRCPHARVGYSKIRHHVVCLDCSVCTHTVAIPRNVYIF